MALNSESENRAYRTTANRRVTTSAEITLTDDDESTPESADYTQDELDRLRELQAEHGEQEGLRLWIKEGDLK